MFVVSVMNGESVRNLMAVGCRVPGCQLIRAPPYVQLYSSACFVHWHYITRAAESRGREAKRRPSVWSVGSLVVGWIRLLFWVRIKSLVAPHDRYSFSFRIWWLCLPSFSSAPPIPLSSAILIHLFPNPAASERSGRFQRARGAVQDLDNVNAAKFPPALAIRPIRAPPYAHLIVRSLLAFLADCRLTTWRAFNASAVDARRKDSHV